MYIMFPIGWMYYFGTNLDTRFQVPDFWPKPEETHKIPFEKDEQMEMKAKLREVRLEKRKRRLEGSREVAGVGLEDVVGDGGEELAGMENAAVMDGDRRFGRGVIERWARGER